MAHITLHGDSIATIGDLPPVKSKPPLFTLTRTDLSDCSLQEFAGKRIVLNIFPSIDTPVCATSVRRFNTEAANLENTVVLCISADLPFAHQRFCAGEGIKDVIPLSVFRSPDFGNRYGVLISTGPLTGLLSRAIVIINKDNKIVYTEQVPEIAQDPDFEAALAALAKCAA